MISQLQQIFETVLGNFAHWLLRNLITELSGDSDNKSAAHVSSFSITDVKLPKLNLPVFNGDVLQWQSFWDQFVAAVDSTDLPDVSKFSYLRASLEGEPKAAIQGLSLTSAHYASACKILKDRFGRKETIIFSHIQKLFNLSVPSKCSVSALWKLNDDLQAQTRSLATLGIDGDKYGVILTPLILSRVPQELRLEWSRDGKGHESDLKFLLSFLEKEIQRRERSQMFQESLGPSFKSSVEERRPRVATASALQATSTVKPSKTCCFCGKNHPTEKCFKLSGSIQVKKEKLKSAGLCFWCLLPGHIAKGCSVVCRKCNGRHHEIICGPPAVGPTSAGVSNVSSPPPPSSGNVNASATHSSSTTSVVSVANSTPPGDMSASHPSVALQFARVTVHGSQGVTEATVMFDTGSDRSYVTQNLVNRVKPKWVDSEPVAFASFGSGKPSKTDLRHIFSVNLQENHGTDQPLLATAVDVICAPLSRPSLGHDILNSFGDISFADHYETGSVVKIDILIGMDSYWRFVLPQVLYSEVADLIAQNSVFGWIVSGCLSSDSSASHCNVSHQLLCVNVCDDTVRSFWELESVGIVSEDLESAVDPVLQEFENSVDFVDGRYEVKLPWRRGASSRLQNNEKLAAIRLQNLNRRLTHEPELQVKYDSVIQNMWSSGIVEEVLPHEQKVDRPIFYMPHRPVVRETAVSSKVRPVFDASARGYNGVSLNDCMEVGPNLLSNLTEILLRFRRWCIGISSDVEKAFLQISVSEGDRDVHRFLWNLGGETKHMRFRRVPFGNCASPFLLNATIQHHLVKFPNSRVIEELKDNLYVDDWLTGADSAEEGCKLIQEASDVMNQAAMPLAKWVSNSPAVAEVLHRDFKDKFIDAESVKVLGMKWLATSDAFSFSIASLPDGLCITKRIILSYLSKLFNPLGIATPYVMGIKCLFQDLWRAGLQWDDELLSEFRVQFLRWVDGLQVLQHWSIPRSYTGTGWSNIRGLALHAFGDASPRGYGACVYLVAEKEDGSVVPSLVIAKAKLAPLKTVTLPRLELLACLLSARLLTFVHDAHRLEKSLRYYCWSDSMVALSWIKADPSRWKAFVANRVVEIQTLTSPDRWFHCSRVENPADLLTRGVTAEELIFSKVWLQGPKFLVERHSDEVDLLEPSAVLCSVMAEETASPVLIAATPGENVFQVERWGKLTKAIRVVALVLHFIFNSRNKQEDRRLGDVSYDEMQHARQVLIQQVQQQEFAAEVSALQRGHLVAKSSPLARLTPYLDDEGLLRVQGRLQFSSLPPDEKHPILIPKSHFAVLLMRFQHFIMKHAGVSTLISAVRKSYWVFGLRRIAKRVKRMCVSCQRQDSAECTQPMAPLPEERVNPAVPFAVTGLDHAGPLYCCDTPRKKYWVILFTCGVVRAVHLELVDTLSTYDTVLAFRRLVARRGLPKVIYSDNAKGFVAAPDKILGQFGPLTPECRFIAPNSPWWGGWWERLGRSVKSALRKTVGGNCLTRAELETTLHEIEACINSRPLTFVSDDPDQEKPLTPSHFLLGHDGHYLSERSEPAPIETADDARRRFDLRQSVVDKFWIVWSSEYLRNLPPWRGVSQGHTLREGSVVLVEADHRPRLQWPLGIITQVFPGKDGLIRTVEVKTSSGKLVRSVQRVHDLEIMNNGFGDTLSTCASPVNRSDNVSSNTAEMTENRVEIEPEREVYRTRFGRAVKPVIRFDI